MALAASGREPVATYFSDILPESKAVAYSHWDAVDLGPVEHIKQDAMEALVDDHPESDWILAAGVPCINVTHLKANRQGAFGEGSILRDEFRRIYEFMAPLIFAEDEEADVLGIMECTAMDLSDRPPYDAVFNSQPYLIDNRHFAANSRPRLWWFSREPHWPGGTILRPWAQDMSVTEVVPRCERLPLDQCLEPGWWPWSLTWLQQPVPEEEFVFCCFTRHIPRTRPMDSPRGLSRCDDDARLRWELDEWCQSPYQYLLQNYVVSDQGDHRRLLVEETEKFMGYPKHYTAPVRHLYPDQTVKVQRARLSLLGNAWSILVLTFILQSLLGDASRVIVPSWDRLAIQPMPQ